VLDFRFVKLQLQVLYTITFAKESFPSGSNAEVSS